MNFWDFCAPFYDIAEKINGRAYGEMLQTVRDIVPHGSTVLEAAAGTCAISIAVSSKADMVLATDVSEKMLSVARRKIAVCGIGNITLAVRSVYDLNEPDNSHDVVIASQVLHLLDAPEKAASELRRVAKSMVIMPIAFTKNLNGLARLIIGVYRLLGFAPKKEFDADDYKTFLTAIGFADCEHIQVAGRIRMAVAVWRAVGQV